MMQCIVLENEQARVAIRPDLGAGITMCDVNIGGKWIAVMRGKRDATWFNDLACYVLAPWSNRIRGSQFAWEGGEIQLKSDWPDGTAIHGDVKAAKFELLDRSPQSVRLKAVRGGGSEQNWPWKYECVVRYQLDGLRLTANVSVRNADTTAMPCGLGLHPFFMTRVEGSAATIQIPVAGRYPCEGMMPTEGADDDALCEALRCGWQIFGGLDDVFSLRAAEFEARVDWPRVLRLNMSAKGGCGHAVIYSGERGRLPEFFCLEPVTHVNDGFNLLAQGWEGTGVRILGAGEEMRLETVFEFERL